MKPNLSGLIALAAIAAAGTSQSSQVAKNHATFYSDGVGIRNTTPRQKSMGGANRKARPGAQMAHIRAARKARNQRRARIAARRGGK